MSIRALRKGLRTFCLGQLRLPSDCFLIGFLICASIYSQTQVRKSTATSTPPAPKVPEVIKDPFNRDTPRGTVIGFLLAGSKGDFGVAAQYLNTREPPQEAAALASQLYIVLDRRLPPRLNEISDRPEGNASDLLNPNLYFVGTITGTHLDITLERVNRDSGLIWLFSSTTLKSIPEVSEEINQVPLESLLPARLATYRIAGISLYEWLLVLIALPLVYLLTVLLNRALVPLVRWAIRHVLRRDLTFRHVLPQPIRLLILTAFIRWMLLSYSLSLLARQFWSSTATLITIIACVWLLMLLNDRSEQFLRDHMESWNLSGIASVQRLIRRSIDLVIIVVGTLVALWHFGVNPTAALAGLGVGGIAIALAAQKTLENVIGGVSLILDKAVRVGDTLKVGDIVGNVDEVGLRSIRIRTLDRTVVVIPNGQLANMNLEVISSRDKFWFHPIIMLRYETTSAQMTSVVDAVRDLLTSSPQIDDSSIRVRFIQMSTFSLNIEVFAYVFAGDWNRFLQIQEELLHGIMAIVERFGAQFAFPSQTMYFATDAASEQSAQSPALKRLPRGLKAASASR